MWAYVSKMPLIVALTGFGAIAMLLPAIVAAVPGEWAVARAFFHYSLFFLVIATMIGLAMANRSQDRPARAPLVDLVTAFAILPMMLAMPLWETVPGMSFLDAYFEMVSSLTTTGASVLTDPTALPDAIHIWRAFVGWLGGLLMWVMAIAILAPMSLGGFEVLGRTPEIYSATSRQIGKTADATARLRYYTGLLVPVYAALTLLLWLGLYLAGESNLVALCHAMATLATSGISPLNGTIAGASGFLGEVMILCFLVFALSRQTFTRDGVVQGPDRLLSDHELRVGLVLAITIPLLLFLRHWASALGEGDTTSLMGGVQALWGGVFTVLSFLTTTGFQSAAWPVAQTWSGIETPGLIFIALALMGGGVATTAGGIKLLRVHVLYRYSQRELERLVHPRAVGKAIGDGRSDWRQGAFIAWIFFMLFAITISALMLALAATGLEFEAVLALSAAALSTTGPLAPMVTELPNLYATLPEAAKGILIFGMVLGRLETLAIISLLNPDFWRA